MNQYPGSQPQYPYGILPQSTPTAPAAQDFPYNTSYPMNEVGYSAPVQYPISPTPVSMPLLTTSDCGSDPSAPQIWPPSTPWDSGQYNETANPMGMHQPTTLDCYPAQYPQNNPTNTAQLPQQSMSRYPHDPNSVITPQQSKYPHNTNLPVSVPAKTQWKPTRKNKYCGNDIPEKNVSENSAEAQLPSASPLPYSVNVPGYEDISHSEGSLIKPPVLNDPVAHSPAAIDAQRFSNITDEDARRALLELVQSNCCWGSKAAKKMDIKDIVGTSAYHYVMESFTEGRRASYSYKPFKGGTIDSPYCETAPLPWDIHCNPKGVFQNETRKIQVPHTEIVTECHRCDSRGFNRCTKCRGRGMLRCGACDGSKVKTVEDEAGNKEEVECDSCKGKGEKICSKCSGIGCTTCKACNGYCSITQYIQLTVVYSHRMGDHIVERTDLPDHLIRNVHGDILFDQTAALVSPIETFYESEINSASKRLVQSHNSSWPAERMLKQKHQLRSVPVHECHFQYKGKPGRFWVYGHQKDVHTCDYPHTCCCCRCCCTIL